jgi:hypothetical protein
MCKHISFPLEIHRFSKVQGFEIEAVLVDNPHLGRIVRARGQEHSNLQEVLRSLAKPGAVLGDVSGIWAPRRTVRRGHTPPPIRAVRVPSGATLNQRSQYLKTLSGSNPASPSG